METNQGFIQSIIIPVIMAIIIIGVVAIPVINASTNESSESDSDAEIEPAQMFGTALYAAESNYRLCDYSFSKTVDENGRKCYDVWDLDSVSISEDTDLPDDVVDFNGSKYWHTLVYPNEIVLASARCVIYVAEIGDDIKLVVKGFGTYYDAEEGYDYYISGGVYDELTYEVDGQNIGLWSEAFSIGNYPDKSLSTYVGEYNGSINYQEMIEKSGGSWDENWDHGDVLPGSYWRDWANRDQSYSRDLNLTFYIPLNTYWYSINDLADDITRYYTIMNSGAYIGDEPPVAIAFDGSGDSITYCSELGVYGYEGGELSARIPWEGTTYSTTMVLSDDFTEIKTFSGDTTKDGVTKTYNQRTLMLGTEMVEGGSNGGSNGDNVSGGTAQTLLMIVPVFLILGIIVYVVNAIRTKPEL